MISPRSADAPNDAKRHEAGDRLKREQRHQDAVNEIDRAFAAFKRGDYQDVLAKCRGTIEALESWGAIKFTAADVASMVQAPRHLEVDERFQLLGHVTKLITHVGAHAGPRGKEITRDDAQLVLATTSNLIRIAPGRLRGRASDEDE